MHHDGVYRAFVWATENMGLRRLSHRSFDMKYIEEYPVMSQFDRCRPSHCSTCQCGTRVVPDLGSRRLGSAIPSCIWRAAPHVDEHVAALR
jgi:hypothetical protein